LSIRIKKRNRKRARERPARGRVGWTTLGTLLAYTVAGGRLAAVARAETAGGVLEDALAPDQGQLPVHRFDIPAGPLGDALTAFQAVTGVTVLVANQSIRALSSPGVSGEYDPERALAELLKGTGAAARFRGPRTVAVELRLQESVLVTGRLSTLSSPKYSEPLRDVPQSISVIPKAMIEQQGATTLRDVLQNVPGLTIQAGEGGAPAGDNLTLRGFSARNDIFVDGVRDLGPQSRDPFNLEQVEVTKGPGSAYAGRGSAGGTINLVSKAPFAGRTYAGTLALGSADAKRVTADVNQQLGDGLAFRLNAMAHDSDVAGRDAVTNQRWGVAPSLSVGLGTNTRLTLGYFHLQQDNLSDYGIPWVPATNNVLAEFRDRPAPVPRETFYGFVSRDHEDMGADLGTLKVEHDFQPRLSLRTQLRYGRSTRDSIATPPRFANTDSTLINREMRSWMTEDEIWDNQTDLSARLSGGGVEHALNAGVALSHETNIRETRTAPNSLTTLLDPNPADVYTGTITPGATVGDVGANSVALYAFDTATLGERFELTGGLRWDRFDADGVTTAAAPVARVDEMFSWRAGAVYKPRPNGSVYAAVGTSLSPSLEGLSYGTANTAIDPEKTRSFELGSKWDLLGERLSLASAVFRVEKTNARTPGILPDDPAQVLEGEQRVDGAELGVSGELTRDLRVFAAYTFLDSRIVESNTPAEVGKELQNTPRHSLSVWATGRLGGRLDLGLGARFVARRFGNNTNARAVDGYRLFDAMASYPVGPHVDLRLNLYNLTDVYYFERLGGGHLVPGAGRSALLSAGLAF
jgi:catecholate siderophore receptor